MGSNRAGATILSVVAKCDVGIFLHHLESFTEVFVLNRKKITAYDQEEWMLRSDVFPRAWENRYVSIHVSKDVDLTMVFEFEKTKVKLEAGAGLYLG